MKTKYCVVNIFDPYFGGLLVNTPRTFRPYVGFTPNAPIPARETLLAERLRTGKHVDRPYRQLGDVPRKYTAMSAPFLRGKLLGIEIEYYPAPVNANPPLTLAPHVRSELRTGIPSQTPLTHVGYDGSLDDNGREVKKLTWQSRSGRLEGLLALRLAGKVNVHCGLHVHVDAREVDDAYETYGRLIGFYPFLKQLCPRSRRTSTYCRWVDNRQSGSRYAAINYEAYEKFGTFEFRCQAGTTNLVKIESWALLCQYLVRWASNPCNAIPRTWKQFLAIIPEPLRSWCILRKQRLYGDNPRLDERTLSALTNDNARNGLQALTETVDLSQ